MLYTLLAEEQTIRDDPPFFFFLRICLIKHLQQSVVEGQFEAGSRSGAV